MFIAIEFYLMLSIQACVHKLHATFDEENQCQDTERHMHMYYYNLCRVNSKHNLNITKQIVAQMMLG